MLPESLASRCGLASSRGGVPSPRAVLLGGVVLPVPVLSERRFSEHLKCCECVIAFDWPVFVLTLEIQLLRSSKAGNELWL